MATNDQRDRYLKRIYGISLETYNSKLEEQNHKCALCEKHKSKFKRNLHVDHNHKTGKVRGLVCFYCNFQLIRKHTADTATRLYVYFKKFDPTVESEFIKKVSKKTKK